MHPVQLDETKLFAGRYRVVRCIAAGGMGAVYEVLHVETDRRRALKVMLPMLVASADLRERFQREARVTAKVNSEFIVDVFDAGVDQETAMPFLVMELLQGEELGELVKRVGSLPPTEVLTFMRQVTTALDKTHAAGIVHRDLKPENLFLTTRDDGSPRIKILDFGISKVVTDNATGGNATQSLGTPLYMAPEQVMGEPVNPATDLYALGLIVYTLLVGASYWQEETERFESAIAFALHTCKGATESPSARAARLGKRLPPGFDAWFFKATHVTPTQRFARASDACAALAEVLADAKLPVAAGAFTPHTQFLTPAARAVTNAGAAVSPAQTGPAPAFAATRPPVAASKSPLLLVAGAIFVLSAGAGATALMMHRSSSVAAEASASAARGPIADATGQGNSAPPPPPGAASSTMATATSATSTAPEVAPPAPSGAAASSAGVARPKGSLPSFDARRPAALVPRASAPTTPPIPATPPPPYTRD